MNASPTEFRVELPLFTGPFRLLAELIIDQKIDVCDVSLARITDRFLHEGMEVVGEWTLEEATTFLALCAALLELKVGRLLPRAPVEAEEDLLGGVSPDLVYARSLELAAFRRVSRDLQDRMEGASLLHGRDAAPPPEFAHLYPDVMAKVTSVMLRNAAAAMLAAPELVDLSHVAPIRASVTDALRTIAERLSVTPEAIFRDLVAGCEERIEVVVSFLALLELYREGKVELRQGELFGDIEVTWHPEPPRSPEAPPDAELIIDIRSTFDE